MQGFDFVSNRVCTDFFDPKFKTFPDFFPKQEFIFPSSRLSNRWSIETFIKAAWTQLFSWHTEYLSARLNKIWPKQKNNNKAL